MAVRQWSMCVCRVVWPNMSLSNKARGNAGWPPCLRTRSKTQLELGLELNISANISNISAARYFKDSSTEPLVPAGCCNFWSNYLQSRIVIGSYNEVVVWQGAWHNPWYKIESFLVKNSPVWKVYNLLWVLRPHLHRVPEVYCGRVSFNGIFHFEKPKSWTGAECLRNRFRSEQFDSP